MLADHTSSSSDKHRRVPYLDPEDYCAWKMSFQAYEVFSEWKLFEKAETVLDASVYAALLFYMHVTMYVYIH